MNNKLKFNEEKTEVQIIFENGSESLYCEYKESAMYMLFDCLELGKITQKEFDGFIKELEDSHLESKIAEIISNFLGLGFLALLTDFLKNSKENIDIEDPSFEMCDCDLGIPHGYFLSNEEKISMKIFSKVEGHYFINQLEKENKIKPGDASGLRVVLDLNKELVDHPLAN